MGTSETDHNTPSPSASAPNTPGTIRDTRMLEKVIKAAVTERYPITAQYREAAVTRCLKVIVDAGAKSREAMSAVRTLAMLDRLNIESAPPPQDLTLHMTGDLTDAIKAVSGLTPEQRAKLAEADRIIEEAANGAG